MSSNVFYGVDFIECSCYFNDGRRWSIQTDDSLMNWFFRIADSCGMLLSLVVTERNIAVTTGIWRFFTDVRTLEILEANGKSVHNKHIWRCTMTLGEKIKEARKAAGLSQEQFAEKMNVSRSAVAKWETDKGLPDIGNLKVMADLLHVSVDYLIDDGSKPEFNEISEPIDLSAFEKTGKCRSKQDAACVAKNENADAIYALIRSKKLSVKEQIVDFVVAPGIIQGADYLRENPAFYLVERGSRQFLVKVTKDFITTSDLAEKVSPSKFVLGSYKFKKSYQLK